MLIEDATFVVTDTETTGAPAGTDRMIEIGAVKIRNGEVVGRFAELVNPGCAVPKRITRLTGISTAMIFDRPAASDVLPRFIDFLGDGIFVAHNLSFDRRVLNHELTRAGMRPLRNDQLCTLRLARRLLPGLRSKGLSSLVDFFDIRMERRHRALDDAAATGEILLRLVDRLILEHRHLEVERLLQLQHKDYVKSIPKHIRQIRASIARRLPPGPGVYFMKDRDGQVIYIGKAKSLKNRVRSYFNAIEGHPGRVRQMLQRVRDVTWEETGTELEALLAESRLIKELRPTFNRALKKHANRPFIRLDVSSPFPTISYVKFIVDDGAEYYGPVRGHRYAEWVVELINRMFKLRECDDRTLALGRRCFYGEIDRCALPCESRLPDAYSAEVDHVRDFLTGRNADRVLVRLEEEMKDCARQLEFEQARECRDSIDRLRRLLAQQETVAAPIMEHNAIHVLRDARLDAVKLFFIRFGRLAQTYTAASTPTEEQYRAIRFLCRKHYEGDTPRPLRYMREEIDEIRILANWLYATRKRSDIIRWNPDLSAERLAEEVLKKIREGGRGESSINSTAESSYSTAVV